MNHVLTSEEFYAELERSCVNAYIGDNVGVYWYLMNDGTVLFDTTIFDSSNHVLAICDRRDRMSIEEAYVLYESIMALNE